MVFIAAGMGGGTGTGAAPVISKFAKEEGCLTIAIVTRPFTFEGQKRTAYSIDGLNELKNNVDSMIVVSNDKLLLNAGNLPIGTAFSEADKVLSQSVRTITDLILRPAVINLDFADVRNILKDSGIALIGFGCGKGENRCEDAAVSALTCPLIEQSIRGKAICHITCGNKVSLYECQETVDKIINDSGGQLDLKFGVSINDELTDDIMLSIIASHFTQDVQFSNSDSGVKQQTQPAQPSTNLGSGLFAPKKPSIFDRITPQNGNVNQNQGNNSPEENKEEINEDDLIIPDFLKD